MRRSFHAGIRPDRCRRWGRRRTGAGRRVTFHPDAQIFGQGSRFKPARMLRMVRSKAYLFSGVEIGWRCDFGLPRCGRRHAGGLRDLPFSGRLERLPERAAGRGADLRRSRLRRQGELRRPLRGRHGRVGGMGDQLDAAARRLRVVLLQHHPHSGGRDARGRVLGGGAEGRARLRRIGLQPQGELDHPRGRDGGRLRDDLGVHPRAGVRRPDQGPAGDAGGGKAGRGRGARPFRQLAGRRTPGPRGRSSTIWC